MSSAILDDLAIGDAIAVGHNLVNCPDEVREGHAIGRDDGQICLATVLLRSGEMQRDARVDPQLGEPQGFGRVMRREELAGEAIHD